MATALIIGSGPSAAGVAMALSKAGDWEITVLDIGATLETGKQAILGRLRRQRPEQWNPSDIASISRQPVASETPGVPEKRIYGSDYPFRNVGQQDGVTIDDGAAPALISGAYGGYSAVWGAQIMPFPDATFANWPASAEEMSGHYRQILEAIPYAAEADELTTSLPLHAAAQPLPPLTLRAHAVLAAYRRHRKSLRGRGLVMGRARLAFDAAACVRCGLCMTGCPHELIYSAASTFDSLRARNLVNYLPQTEVVAIGEDADHGWADVRHLDGNGTRRLQADRIFVAAGVFGTSKLVLASRQLYDSQLFCLESAQFILPFLSMRSTGDPRDQPAFTLGQVNAVMPSGPAIDELSHLQLYMFNPSFTDQLPAPLRRIAGASLLARLSVGLGYLPSDVSPRLAVRLHDDGLHVRPAPPLRAHRDVMRHIVRTLMTAAPRLDLWPLLPRLQHSAPGKSYHCAGTFPYRPGRPTPTTTDRWGRPGGWKRIHLADPTTFPSVAATTFTLTAMANAHRIASACAQGRIEP